MSLLLIDGSNLLHRCYAVSLKQHKNLVDENSINYCIYLFLRSIGTFIKKEKGLLCIAWDSGIPVFRRSINKNYKARKKFDEEDGLSISESWLPDNNSDFETEEKNKLLLMFSIARKFLHNIIPYTGNLSIKIENSEADDIISYLSFIENTIEKIILSSDNDLTQLVSINTKTCLYDGIKKTYLYESDYINENGKDWRIKWLYKKSILGDKSDGIVGVDGVSERTVDFYVEQLSKFVKFDELKKHEKTNDINFIKFKNSTNKLFDNFKLIDLKFSFSNKDYKRKIEKAIFNSLLLDIDESYVIDKIKESNINNSMIYVNSIIDLGYDYLKTKKSLLKIISEKMDS